MTDHAYNVIGLALIVGAVLLTIALTAEQVIQHVREERGRKPRPLPGALGASMEARIAETWPPLDPETPIYSAVKRQHDVQFMAEAIEELRGLGVDLESES